MVHRRQGQLGTAHSPPGEPEALESLGARHLVNQVQIYVDEIWLPLGAPYHMLLPHLLYQRLGPIHQRPSRYPRFRVPFYHCRPRTCDLCIYTRSPRSRARAAAWPYRSPTQPARTVSRPSRRPPRHHVQTDVIQGRPAVHPSHLLRHPCREGAPLLLRQLLQVPAQHDRPEKAGELVHRIERRDLVVQPGLDLLEARGLQTPRRGPGVGVVLVVLPAHEIVQKTLLSHRLPRRPRGAGDVALATALGDEAPTRLQGPRQVLEETVMVPYPVECCRGEDQIHTLFYFER